ncbi:MAG: hypothetical protein WA182_12040 [Candidatus Sulfotelmatobacter sp.]
MKTDAALNNLAQRTVAGVLAKNPRDKERALAALLAATLAAINQGPVKLELSACRPIGIPLPAYLRGVEFR